MIARLEKAFEVEIERPIEVLIATISTQQKEKKKAAIPSAATMEELSEIARQMRELDKPCFQQRDWIREMGERLTVEFGELTEMLQQQFY